MVGVSGKQFYLGGREVVTEFVLIGQSLLTLLKIIVLVKKNQE